MTAKELTFVYEASLEPFSPPFQKPISEYPYGKYCLDKIVVAAIAPLIQGLAADWNPLKKNHHHSYLCSDRGGAL
jgi:tuftelin-interacting protein 11